MTHVRFEYRQSFSFKTLASEPQEPQQFMLSQDHYDFYLTKVKLLQVKKVSIHSKSLMLVEVYKR